MARKPESQFIAGVHKYIDPDVYSMKNHNEYNAGIFDCWYSARPKDLWIEYKFIEIPKRDATLIMPDLSPLQLEWGRARAREGRQCWVIIGSKEGGIILGDPDDWTQPIEAGTFRIGVQSRKELGAYITKFVTS